MTVIRDFFDMDSDFSLESQNPSGGLLSICQAHNIPGKCIPLCFWVLLKPKNTKGMHFLPGMFFRFKPSQVYKKWPGGKHHFLWPWPGVFL